MSVETVESAGPTPKKGVSILFGLTLVGLLVVLWLLLGLATNAFWTPNNISNLLRQGAMTAILAVGQTFVIITAGIDLSVGAVVGFTSVIVAWLLAAGVPLWLAIIATLAIGVLIGAFHAFGIVRMGLPPFIITLATLTSLRGIGLLITNGSTISITNDAFTTFSRADFLGIPSLFWMVIVVAIPAYVFLQLSRFGAISSPSAPTARRRAFPRQRKRTIYWPISVIDLRRFVGLLLASRIGIRQRHAGRRLGGCRRSLRRSSAARAFSARVASFTVPCWRLHPCHDQQRCQSPERQFLLAAHHHRAADHRDRLFRPVAAAGAAVMAALPATGPTIFGAPHESRRLFRARRSRSSPAAGPRQPPTGSVRLARHPRRDLRYRFINIFEGKHPFLEYPRVMGHEISARVIEGGPRTRLAPGTLVVVNPYLSCGECIACRKGKRTACTAIRVLGVHTDRRFCEEIVMPEQTLYSAEGLSPEAAAAVEFLAIGAHRRPALGGWPRRPVRW